MHIVYLHEDLSLFFYTHWVIFCRLWIYTSRLDVLFNWLGVDELVHVVRSWSFSLFGSGIFAFLYSFYYPFDSLYISDSTFIPVLDLYDIMCGHLYELLQW